VVAVNRIAYFTARRLVAGLFTVALLITITFVVFWAIPSQPETFLYPTTPHITAFQLHNADKLMGLDQPKFGMYLHDLWHTITLNFGHRWSGEQLVPINKLQPGPLIGPGVYSALRVTLSLILGGAVVVLLLAVPLGTLAGSRIGSWTDRTISLVALIALCLHPMILGLILRSLFGRHLGWTPQYGYCPIFNSSGAHLPSGPYVANGSTVFDPTAGPTQVCHGLGAWASHMALPWLTFGLLFLALYTRMVRVSVAETLREDYVRTARAKGAGELRVLSRHVLPNATLRILTMIGMEIGTAIGICIYLESAFRLGGLASGAVTAFGGNSQLDLPYMLAVVTMLTLIVVIGNIVVDVLYAVVDPRVGRTPPRRQEKAAVGGVI
jgi:peptide/nickel transport system permease protein